MPNWIKNTLIFFAFLIGGGVIYFLVTSLALGSQASGEQATIKANTTPDPLSQILGIVAPIAPILFA